MNISTDRLHLPHSQLAGNRNRQAGTLSNRELATAKVIGFFSPKAAMSFMRSRLALNQSIENLSTGGQSGYQAAQRRGPNEGWNPASRASEDAILSSDASLIRARSRDLVRNNGYVAGAIRRIVNNVIHKGIKPQITVKTGKGSEHDRKASKALEKEFKKWAKRVKLKKYLKLKIRHLVMDGEGFGLQYMRPELVKERVVPLWIKGVEPDQVDDGNSSLFVAKQKTSGEIIRNGVACNEHDEAVAYYMYPFHPGDVSAVGQAWTDPIRVDARYVTHLYDPMRMSQHRGVSVIAPVVMSMHDIHELTNSELIAARLMAAFGVFVTAPSSGFDPENMGAVDPEKTKAQLDQLTDYLDPGRVQILPEGADVKQAENTRPGPQFDAINQASLRQSASGFNQDYEVFSGDYRGSSFIASRSASQETRRGYQVMTDLLVDEELDPIFDIWVMAGRMSGLLPLSASDEVSAVWIGSGWPWIDPKKDIEAKEREIALCVTSRSEVAASQGKDFEDVAERIIEEERYLENLRKQSNPDKK